MMQKFQVKSRVSVQEGERITVQSNPPMRSIRWSTEAATRLGNLRSIEASLDFVIESVGRALSCDARRDRNGNVRDPVGFQAYFSAAVVAYARCYDPPKDGLAESDVETLRLIPAHRKFIDLRNLHVAHQVGDFWERREVAVLLRDTNDPARREVIGSGCLFVKATATTGDEMRELGALATKVRELVRQRAADAEATVLTEAEATPLAELYARAAEPRIDPVRGPSSSAPRRRRK